MATKKQEDTTTLRDASLSANVCDTCGAVSQWPADFPPELVNCPQCEINRQQAWQAWVEKREAKT